MDENTTKNSKDDQKKVGVCDRMAVLRTRGSVMLPSTENDISANSGIQKIAKMPRMVQDKSEYKHKVRPI